MNAYITGLRRISGPSGKGLKKHGDGMLTLLHLQQPVDLAGISRLIAADSSLSRRVTEAARAESGWPQVEVEDAIVLLGVQRLHALLSGYAAENSAPANRTDRLYGDGALSLVPGGSSR
jgi:hypothetical protein